MKLSFAFFNQKIRNANVKFTNLSIFPITIAIFGQILNDVAYRKWAEFDYFIESGKNSVNLKLAYSRAWRRIPYAKKYPGRCGGNFNGRSARDNWTVLVVFRKTMRGLSQKLSMFAIRKNCFLQKVSGV